MTTSTDRVVLPLDIKPQLYRLVLEPDLQKFTFEGSVSIEFSLQKATKRLELNVVDLQIHDAFVTLSSGQETIKTSKIDYDKEEERVIFEFESEITCDGTLQIKYTGELNDKMVGFYRSEYKVPGTEETRYMASTQCEATDARRILPCWDEPSVKARFACSLIIPRDRTALGNMEPIKTQDLENSKKRVDFEVTPVMSTYLLCFVVGELESIEEKTTRGTTVRVFTQKGKSELGRFALDVAVKCVPLFEEFFGVDYPLPKMDMVAIPQFAAGAMENWGLITYRETALLVDPKNTSAATKQWVALVVAHEISHQVSTESKTNYISHKQNLQTDAILCLYAPQWFGNIVTFDWWDNLWLNEGFATWVEYWAINELYPEWRVFQQFVFSEFADAQHLDGLESSHPIQVPINRAQEVDELFDAIAYDKGCCVIRMLVEWLGLPAFQQGLRTYLKRHSYANTTEKDLWRALSEASGQDVVKTMDNWIKQTGYPVLLVTEEGKTSAGKRRLKLRQHRYLDSGLKENDTSLWHIPVSYITDKQQKPVFMLMSTREQEIEVDDDIQFIKFNPNQTGFYRVQYPSGYYDSLVAAIQSKALGPIDRLGVQADAFALARAGYLSSFESLKILFSFGNEDDYTVWQQVTSNCADVYYIIRDEPFAEQFRAKARALFKTQADKLGWEPRASDDHLTSLMRPLMISQMAKYEDPATMAECRKRFDEYVADPQGKAIIPDLRNVVYTTVVKRGGEEEFNQMLKLMEGAELNEEKVRCIRGFCATKKDELVLRALDMVRQSKIKQQDSYVVTGAVPYNTSTSREIAWKWLRENIDWLREQFQGGFIIGRIIKGVVESFITEDKADEAEKYFAEHPIPQAQQNIKQAVESVRLTSRWLQRDKAAIAKYFDKQ